MIITRRLSLKQLIFILLTSPQILALIWPDFTKPVF